MMVDLGKIKFYDKYMKTLSKLFTHTRVQDTIAQWLVQGRNVYQPFFDE